MRTKTFWMETLERAVKTLAQSLIAAIGAGAAVPVWELGWAEILGIALTATVLSVLTSIASAGAGQPGTPSAVAATSPQSDGLVHGAQAAELAGIPTANPDDPRHETDAEYTGQHRAGD